MNARQRIEKREARSERAFDLLLLSSRIRETEAFLDCLRRRRDTILDHLDAALSRRLAPAAQERILEDVLSAPGPLDQKLAHGMRIVHSPPEDETANRRNGDAAEGFDPDPEFAQRVADEAKTEAAEMAQEQARRIACQDPDGNWILECLECGNEFKTAQRRAMCPDCTDRFTDSNGQA